MEFHDDRDDLADDGGVTAHRARAAAMLDQITQQVRQALTEQGIDLSLFFLIPSSGDSILIYGCAGDPPDNEWSEVGEIVEAVVRQTVGLDRVRRREVLCASTDSIAAPMPMASLQYSGADQ